MGGGGVTEQFIHFTSPIWPPTLFNSSIIGELHMANVWSNKSATASLRVQ